ncbi:HigA family addiction module antitoxin [Roseateles sp.]|uniref:HigA family addiction module antitoxin n=1 Tax=Roseateles sp. TaxID=1971397 RepID=UPI002E06D43F|nr:HigA family addiction module antitoxin [Roseateles sp.]HEV6968823.1 HigA family addiction module antitoxin [Roseateles sp.]
MPGRSPEGTAMPGGATAEHIASAGRLGSGPALGPQAEPTRRGLRHPPAGVPVRLPTHPGRFLQRHYLAPLALSQSDAARRLGMSRRRLHEIVHGQRAVSPDTALRCALVFGSDAAFLLALQSAWDSFHAWKQMRTRSRLASHP